MQTKRVLPKVSPDILAKMEINKEDLLAIAVSRHEENLEVEKKKLDLELQKLSDEMAETANKLNRSVQVTAEGSLKSTLETAINTLQEAGFEKLDFQILSSLSKDQFKNVEDEDRELADEDYEGFVPRTSVAYYVAKITQSLKNNYQAIFTTKGQFDLGIEQKGFLARIREIDNTLTEKRQRAVEIRSELANLGRKERQARARLALKVLEQSEEGKALLDSIQDIKSLPGD